MPSGQATHGEGYFELGPGIMLPQTAWHSEVSAELYNQNNPEKARQLLEEAGYDGTPIRLLCTQEDLGDYNAAVVAQQQLEAGGIHRRAGGERRGDARGEPGGRRALGHDDERVSSSGPIRS